MAEKKECLITSEGFLKLEEQLNDLKLNKRPEIIQQLKEARAQGDLSENADYDAARTAQAELESKIKEIEYTLEHAKIIDNKGKNVVSVGSTVTINYIEEGEEEEYTIVGSLEADPLENKISNESPIGLSLMNKKVGDIISVDSPNGSYDIKIIKIS